MKSYLTVMRMLVKNMFKKNPGEKKGLKIFTGIVLGILYISILFGMISTIIAVAPTVGDYGLQSDVLTFIFAMAIMIILVFGITQILTGLYFSKDTEFFLSLPVSTGTVYFAKMTVIYLGMMAVEAAIMIPCLIAMGITLKMSVLFYIVGLVAALFLPALPLMLASIIAMPLMFLVSSFKNKGAMTSIVTLILFALVFGAYYFVMFRVSGNVSNPDGAIDFSQIILSLKESLSKMSDILLPLSAIARLATLTPVYGLSVGMSALVNAGIFVGFTAVLAAIAFGVSSTVYKHGATKIAEGTNKRDAGKKRDYKSSGGAIKALVAKEWRQTLRTPAFALNCLLFLVIVPIIIAVLNMTSGQMSGETALDSQFSYMSVFMIMMMGVGMNYGACTCFTREGETFAFSKSLPVDFYDLVKAKQILYILLGYICIAVSSVIMLIFSRDFWLFVISVGLFVPYNIAYVNFAVWYDLSCPRLKWTNPKEATRRDIKGMVPFFINAGVSMVFLFTTWLPRILISTAQSEGFPTGLFSAIYIGAWVVFYVVALALAVVSHVKLKKAAARLCERVEI